MIKLLAWLTLLLLVVFLTPNFAQTPDQQTDDAAFKQALENGKDLFRKHKYDEALTSFRRANEMRDKKCAICYAWMADTYFSLEAYKSVIAAADKGSALAGTDTQLLLK